MTLRNRFLAKQGWLANPADDNYVVGTLLSNGHAHSGFRDGDGLVTGVDIAATLRGGGSGDSRRGYDLDAEQGIVLSVRMAQTGGNGIGDPDSVAHTLDGANGQAVAFTERSRKEGRTLETQADLSYALTNPGSGGRSHDRNISYGMTVRRLLPIECERLQGFPDDWTATDAAGKPVSDSARYRMLGNAIAVPAMDWIARRLATVAEQTP